MAYLILIAASIVAQILCLWLVTRLYREIDLLQVMISDIQGSVDVIASDEGVSDVQASLNVSDAVVWKPSNNDLVQLEYKVGRGGEENRWR